MGGWGSGLLGGDLGGGGDAGGASLVCFLRRMDVVYVVYAFRSKYPGITVFS